METNILREKLTEYIQVADEKKVEALYTLLMEDIESDYKWYEDKAFVAELDDRYNKVISGEDKGYSIEEAVAYLAEIKPQATTAHV